MKSTLKTYRQSPRKVRLIADLICGKRAPDALKILRFANKRAAKPVRKILESAIANARNSGVEDTEELSVKSVQVDEGTTLKRFMPRAFGRATPLRRRRWK